MMASLADDPYGYVMTVFPWGKPGPLEHYDGPDTWQRELLLAIGKEVAARRFDGHTAVLPVRVAVSSGHGIGKSTLSGWLANWIMSTRPYSKGTVTANTFPQLQTKTWPAVVKWTRLSLTSHWFETGAQKVWAKESPDEWFVAAQTCRKENSEAFHGQHAATSTSWYLFDEASAIADEIWDVAEGGLTDGEPMIVAFGNPTRNSGKFHKIMFGAERDRRWLHRIVDSRTCRFPNHEVIAEWLEDWGEDSDFFRVRVRGIAPRAGDLQFIPSDYVSEAMRRLPQSLPDDPLIAGFDPSGGGAAWNVIAFRKGYDARSIPAIRIPGEHTRGTDRSVMVAKLAEILRDERPGRKVAMMFIDAAFGAPYVERLKGMGFTNVQEVSFGAPSPDRHCANMRAYMWDRLKSWLEHGAVESAERLETDLTAPGCQRNRKDQLVLESKQDMVKRGVDSPDWGDALCFVAGTKVKTAQGWTPIEQIRIGDMVVTPFGDSPVVKLHQNAADCLTTAQFSNGVVLTGTPNHDVFTFQGGHSRLDALALTNEVDVYSRWRLLLWRFVSLSFIGARSSGFKQAAHTFNQDAIAQRKDFFIAGCGLTFTALFQRVTQFITSMRTGEITTSLIWNCANLSSTGESTLKNSWLIQSSERRPIRDWNSPGSPPLSGIDQRKGWPGIKSTAHAPGKAANLLTPNAPVVARNIKPSSQPVQNTVPAPARSQSHSAAILRMFDSARTAAKSLWRTVTGRQPVVPVSVQTASAPPTRTYNLTLADHHAYYANGILVFNCLTFAAFVPPVTQQAGEREYYRQGVGSWMG